MVDQADSAGKGYILTLTPLESNYDPALRTYVTAKMSLHKTTTSHVHDELTRFGTRCVGELNTCQEAMERWPPQLQRYNLTGRKISRLITCKEWKRMHEICAEEGLVALGYGPNADRVVQFLKLAMFGGYSGLYTCPLAMTDGCAKLLQGRQDQQWQFASTFAKLTSRDPHEFITSGQWMTERAGGSDVRDFRTICKKQDDGSFLITGYKWFCSAADARVTVALAKHENANKLSCFLIQVYDETGNLSPGLSLENIKDKLGTRQLPTCEVELKDVKATLVGDEGAGIKTIFALVNVTRIYNAIAACGYMGRALGESKQYAKSRKAFGKYLSEHDLHAHTFFHLEAIYRGCLYMTLDAAQWLEQSERGSTDSIKEDASIMLRLLTPLTKAYTAKAAVFVVQEALESMGGLGYLETSGMARLLRDTHVLPVWEGTTNIQALDIWRVFSEGKGALGAFEKNVRIKVAKSPLAEAIDKDLKTLQARASVAARIPINLSRELLMAMAQIYACACLCEIADRTEADFDKELAEFYFKAHRGSSLWGLGDAPTTSTLVYRQVFSKL